MGDDEEMVMGENCLGDMKGCCLEADDNRDDDDVDDDGE